jgi:hypothetical protein
MTLQKMADFLTDKEEIRVVYQAAQQLGIAEKLTSENPATKSGSTAELLMAGIASSRPDIAARLRNRAGVVPSLEAVAAQHGYAAMNDAAKQSLMHSDEQFAKDAAANAIAEEERILASMSAGADQLARSNRGDKRVDAEIAQEAINNSPEAVAARARYRQDGIDIGNSIQRSRQAINRGHV